MPACTHGISPLGACSTCTPPGPASAVIRSHAEHRKLNEGDLVLAADGELLRVTKPRSAPEETWLERWSDEYAITLADSRVDGDGEKDVFPLTRVNVVPVAASEPVLTEGERRDLAMHAHYESGRQDDVRYWDPDPEKRLALKRRWRKIADWLHAEPWGEPTPGLRFILGTVEAGRVTAWNAGHVKPVRVVRNTADDQPLVACPDCGGTASVGSDGSIRCVEVSTCGGGWQVLVVPAPES
jgi:hypothetical protein